MTDVSYTYVCPLGPLRELPLRTPLAVGETVWSGDDERVWLRRFERRAAADPDHVWVVDFYGPLSGSTYRRVDGVGWVLVATNKGFA